MMWRLLLFVMPGMAMADSLVATRTLPAQTVLQAEDVMLVPAEIPGALTQTSEAVGLEARVAIYAGRPISAGDIGAASILDRNQIVQLAYHSGGLAILTEGRALARGGVGDVIRVMNLVSRNTVSGRISVDGTVVVGPNP